MEARLQPVTAGIDRPPLIIRRVDSIPVGLPLQKAVAMAAGTVSCAYNLLVRVEAADGTVGWGEAASAPTMTGDTLGGLVAAVRDHLAPLLVGGDAWMRAGLCRKLRHALLGNSGAHSAVEMALFDLAGQACGLPLADFMGGAMRREVAPMWLIGNATVEQDIAEAQCKHKQGFAFFKLKIATRPVETDIAAALELRKALGARAALCADANCGMTFTDACRFIDGTVAADLVFVEQPLAHDDLAGLGRLARRSPTPIGADEGIHSLTDIEAHERCGAGGVSLKLIKLGGISAALEAAQRCHRLGLRVNVAAKIAESSIASAAAIHLACVVPAVDWGVSMTHFYLAEDIAKNAPAVVNGTVRLPVGAGLGVEVDEAAIERFRIKLSD